MKRTYLTNHHSQACAALLVADAVVFGLIDPTKAAAVWLIVGYLLLGVTILAFIMLLTRVARGFGESVAKKVRRTALYAAAVIFILVGLQSIGQLTVRDVLSLGACVTVAYVYFGYNKRVRSSGMANSQ